MAADTRQAARAAKQLERALKAFVMSEHAGFRLEQRSATTP